MHTLAAGQPAPYADTEHVVTLHFERITPLGALVYRDYPVTEEQAMKAAEAFPCGFTRVLGSERKGHFDTYLDYFRSIGPAEARDDTGRLSLSTGKIYCAKWKFRTVSPYTD